tara:strand:- start:2557 stop:4098 length:1542 start_codon:yes stop_codon:yes gene_type:complete
MNKTEVTYLGPPGTGKTQRNSNLVRKCIEDGIAPDKIANVSFTTRAATESQDRVCHDWGLEEDGLPYFQTLHSMAFRAGGYNHNEVIAGDDLKALGDYLGMEFSRPKKRFETDLERFGFTTEGDRYLNLYSYARSVCKDYEEVFRVRGDDRMQWPVFKLLVTTYEKYKRFYQKIDFTDMIEHFIAMDTCPDIEALLCDEAQDLSTLQWKMISVLRQKPSIQAFFGDDDQAIMNFAGADVAAFQQCTEKKEVLTQSYRVPQAVHEVAESISKKIVGRLPKTWRPRPYQGFVFEHLGLDSIPLHEGEWLLLTRTNRLADRYGRLLREAGWVYKNRHGEPSIALGLLDAIVDWEAWIRGVKLLPSQIKQIYHYLKADVGYREGYAPSARIFSTLDATVVLSMDEARVSLGLLAPKDIWKRALTKVDDETKHYILSARRRGDTVKNPRITVSTIHSMKGAERDNVVLVPELNWASYDEYRSNPNPEHRVWYVAATRAKESLHILNSNSLSHHYAYPI